MNGMMRQPSKLDPAQDLSVRPVAALVTQSKKVTDMSENVAAQPLQEEGRPAQPSVGWQVAVGWFIVLAAMLLAWATWHIPSQMYVLDGGARLVPGLCATALLLCGLWLVWEARHGGWRNAAALNGYSGMKVTPCVWVSAGILLSGLLMAHSGFVLAAALCYVLALQGLRLAAQPDLRVSGKRLASDVAVGVLIAGVVYGLFTQVLGIDLPAGWLAWN